MTISRKQWYIVIIVAVAAALGIAGYNIQTAKKAANEQAMIYQLKQLRTAVQIYEKMQKSLPSELKTVMTVTVNGKAVPIQWTLQKDTAGNLVDPFGGLYQYDKKSGWVKSGTQGYESW